MHDLTQNGVKQTMNQNKIVVAYPNYKQMMLNSHSG